MDDARKQVDVYKTQVDLINEKYGGITAVQDMIKIAKLKEQSVGNLMHKLDTCIVSTTFFLTRSYRLQNSTEGHLQCYKCIEIFTDPVVLEPCGHALCRLCLPADGKCPDCERTVTGQVPFKLLEDLTHKHNFNKEALTSFKNDKTWQNALKAMSK